MYQWVQNMQLRFPNTKSHLTQQNNNKLKTQKPQTKKLPQKPNQNKPNQNQPHKLIHDFVTKPKG